MGIMDSDVLAYPHFPLEMIGWGPGSARRMGPG
jgi:hypothetical protein